MTYRFLAHDILTTLKKTNDDKDIGLMQVIYWAQVIINKHRAEELKEKRSMGHFTSTFRPVTVSKDATLNNRKYIDLPAQIMSLSHEAGVNYISYNIDTGCCCDGDSFTQTFFQPTTVTEAFRLFMDTYEKPQPDNPYFYRVGEKVNTTKVDRLYLLGVECIDLKDVEVSLKTTLDPTDVCDLDEEVPIGEDRLHQVIIDILSLGRFAMMIPEERINDGADLSNEPKVPVPQSTTAQTEEQ